MESIWYNDEERRTAVFEKLMAESDNNRRYSESKANDILSNTIPELEINIHEWVLGQELSDIMVGELSLNMLFEFWGCFRFRDGIVALNKYRDRGYKKPGIAIEEFLI